MRYFVVHYFDYCGDEFVVAGVRALTEDELNALTAGIRSVKYPCSPMCGSNEWIDYSSADEVLKALKIEEVSIRHYNVVKRYTNKAGFFIHYAYEEEDDREWLYISVY